MRAYTDSDGLTCRERETLSVAPLAGHHDDLTRSRPKPAQEWPETLGIAEIYLHQHLHGMPENTKDLGLLVLSLCFYGGP